MNPLLTGALGLLSGAAGVMLFVWWPTVQRYRRLLGDAREIHRIEGGFAAVASDLDDYEGALAQAQAAYIAVYPGRGEEPDPAWVAWLRSPVRPDLVVAEPVYRPQHLTVDDEPTTALAEFDDLDETVEPIRPQVLQHWDKPDDRFPVWGAPPPKAPAPVGWVLAWSWRDWPLIPIALALALIPARRKRYPWYQRVADRTWEAGVVFEVTGLRVNRAIITGVAWLVSRMVWGLADAFVVLATGAVSVRKLVPQRPVRPRPRPKRLYPIEEG